AAERRREPRAAAAPARQPFLRRAATKSASLPERRSPSSSPHRSRFAFRPGKREKGVQFHVVFEPVPEPSFIPERRRVLPLERVGALVEILICSGFPTQVLLILVMGGFGVPMRAGDGRV